MWTSAAAADDTRSARHDRRREVEAALAPFVTRGSLRRVPPPEGRLGVGDYPIRRLRVQLAAMGPVFASFGRYLSTRPDLLPRRDCAELAEIPDVGAGAEAADIDALVHRQLGAPPARRFFEFDIRPRNATLWTERHDAWVAPGVPVVVTIVRPDAAAWLERDLPLLSLVQPCFALAPAAFAAAVEDFARTLRLKLDQMATAAALATLSSDVPAVQGFEAPTCYRDYCSASVLTLARADGRALSDIVAGRDEEPRIDRAALARRVAAAWLRQALVGHVVPFDFDARDITVDGAEGDRIVLSGGALESHSGPERARFSRYVNAVAADDPDTATAWIVDAAGVPAPPVAVEDELKRRFRQAVPFRDGEWSGDDRLAEFVLVQWRVAREAGWRLTPHHLHLYRGLHSIARIAEALAPAEDPLLAALQDERLRIGRDEAIQMLDPRAVGARLDAALQEMVSLPQRLDEVLTLAAEGRLRVRLQVPEAEGTRRVKHQTIALVALLVVLVAAASLIRHVEPALGAPVERAAVIGLLGIGGWLLVAAARL